MWIFDRLFGKKEEKSVFETEKTYLNVGDTIISAGDNLSFKVIHQLSPLQKEKMQTATIPVMVAPLYMHYFTDDLVCEGANDQNWLNQIVFFWKVEELFPNKSLPAIFETFKTKNFIFTVKNDSISLSFGRVAP